MKTHDVVLKGRFINLRPLESKDAELTLSWRLSSRSRYLNAGAQSVEAQEKWISSRANSEFNFIIELKDETSVGMISLIDINNTHRRAEPSRFLIGNEKAVEGAPAAAEAMKLLFGFAFDELKLLRMYGTVAADNTKMTTWNKFLGMKEEGRLRNHLFLDGKFMDAIFLSLLEPEYREITIPRLEWLLQIAAMTKICCTAHNSVMR